MRLWLYLSAVLVCLCVFSDLAIAQKKNAKLPSQEFKGYGGLPAKVKTSPTASYEVVSVDAARAAECRQTALKIDGMVEKKLAEQGLAPNSPTNDHTFVRRVFLDAVGTIPTLIETNAFASSVDARKHEMLIDQLLSTRGYVSHMYNFWASILRVKDRPNNAILAENYRNWLKAQLRVNRPYDEWVYEMLTAEGKIWDNPAVGYVLRDNGMPLVHVDNTVRVFLGTQIGCAQCHDHPFDRWTQKEFYQLAAFTYGTSLRDGGGSAAFANGNPVERVRKDFQQRGEQLLGVGNLILQANLFRVSFDAGRKLKLPHDYQYDDGKPQQNVDPQALWGDVPATASSKSKREQFAAWLTSADNPRFAKTIANRLWKKVMGVGLIEPVDSITEETQSANDELLEFLAAEMIRLKFDQKEFIRTLMYTKTYQRSNSDFDPSLAEFYYFPGPSLRRMTAEQIWDSILTIAVYNPYSDELPDREEVASIVDADMSTITSAQVTERSQRYDESLSPAAQNKLLNAAAGYRRQVLVRASELPSPVPADHFLRQFGQGDRETIGGDSTDPTVPQILTMFNGPFTHMMLEKGSVIHDSLSRAVSSRDATNVMFLSILNRPPTSRDREIAMQELPRGDRAMGYGNLVWALINTREFIFIQ